MLIVYSVPQYLHISQEWHEHHQRETSKEATNELGSAQQGRAEQTVG